MCHGYQWLMSKELYAHAYYLVDWFMSHCCLRAFTPKVALSLFVSLLVIAFSPNSMCFSQSSTHPLLSYNYFICIYLTTCSLLFWLDIKPSRPINVATLCLMGLKTHSNGQHNPNQLCDCLIHVTPHPISGKNLHVQSENNFNDVATNLKAQRIEGFGIYAWSKVSRPNNIL